MHRTDYSSNNFPSVSSRTQNSYWHKTEIAPHVAPISYFLQVTAVVCNYNRKYLPMQLFWNITFGVFMGAKASYQLKLSFPGHMSHVAQDTSISTLLHEFPWWKVVRGSFTTSTHQGLQENVYSSFFNKGKTCASAPFKWLKQGTQISKFWTNK